MIYEWINFNKWFNSALLTDEELKEKKDAEYKESKKNIIKRLDSGLLKFEYDQWVTVLNIYLEHYVNFYDLSVEDYARQILVDKYTLSFDEFYSKYSMEYDIYRNRFVDWWHSLKHNIKV